MAGDNDNAPTRAFGYTQASLARGQESPEIQRGEIERAATYLKMDLAEIIGDRAEAAVGIAFADRPGGRRLLAVPGPGDWVIVKRIDRLGSTWREIGDILTRLLKRGVRVWSCDLGEVSAANPTSKMLLGIIDLFAEYDRDMRTERTTAGIRQKIARGFAHGPVAMGKQRIEVGRVGGKTLKADVWDPAVLELIGELYDRVENGGESVVAVALDWHRRRVKRANGEALVRKSPFASTRLGRWYPTVSQLCRMLRWYKRELTSGTDAGREAGIEEREVAVCIGHRGLFVGAE